MPSKQFKERTFPDAKPRVDEQAGVLYGVKLLGERSENNRLYGKEVREAALPHYKGVRVYVDDGEFHQSGTAQAGSMDRWAGTITEAENRADGIYGNVKLRKKSSFYEGILEVAGDEDFSRGIGCSHVADGDAHLDGDTEIVESINKVFNVALVMEPATTAGMWESKDMKTQKTVKQILEAKPQSKWGKLLKEQMDAGTIDAEMPVEAAETADPAAEVEAALEKAAVAVLRKLFAGELEEAAAMAEIKKILGMKEEVTEDSGSEAPAELVAESIKPDPEVGKLREQLTKLTNQTAQLTKESAELKAKNLLLESGREATLPRIKAMASASESDRKELLESWPKKENAERPDRSPPRYSDDEYDTELPDSADKFAASILR